MATAHRNYVAVSVIAGGNFADRPNIFLLLLTASLISMIVVLLVGGSSAGVLRWQELSSFEPRPSVWPEAFSRASIPLHLVSPLDDRPAPTPHTQYAISQNSDRIHVQLSIRRQYGST